MCLLSSLNKKMYNKLIKKGQTILIVNRQYSKKFETIPGPKSLPGVGTLYQYLPLVGRYRFDTLHHNGFKKYKKFGPVVKEEIVPGVNIVWLFDPRDIENMFRCEGKYPQRRSHLALEKYRLDRPNVYNSGGLLPTNGPEWLKMRSVFQRGLSSPQSVQNFLYSSDEIIAEWMSNVPEVQKDTVDFLPELSRLFLELTVMTILDLRLNSFSRQERKSYSRSSKLINAALVTNSCILKTDNGPQLWRKFNTPLYTKLSKSQKFMEDVAIDLLSLQMSLFHETNPGRPPTLFKSYLTSPELDFKDIIGIVCDFLLAGIDTTTYTTSFLLYHLAKSHTVQAKLHEEACKLLEHTYSSVTKDMLQEAVYAKAVLKEVFRLRPISVGIGRVLQTDTEFGGYHVPSGTVVVSQNQVSCRLNENFSSAHEFKPERWLKDHPLYKKPDPFLLLPFGHGPRSCIARRLAEQNMLVFMLKFVRNYKLRWTGSCLDSKSLLINKPNGPILLHLEKRSS